MVMFHLNLVTQSPLFNLKLPLYQLQLIFVLLIHLFLHKFKTRQVNTTNPAPGFGTFVVLLFLSLPFT